MGSGIQDEHWRGAISLKLELHADEVTTVPPPEPLFILAPRLGYLPQVSKQALQQFKGFLPPGIDEPWFEYKGVPLKWQIPTGALYDLLSDGEYPWCLTIHFRAYPKDALQPISGDETLQASYLNSLKEAAYVLTGNSSAVMSLTTKSQQELWQNVLEGQHSDFFQNMEKMELMKPVRSRIPIRIYAREKVFDSFTGWKSIDYASKSLHIDAEAEEELTARFVLKRALGGYSDEDMGKTKLVVAGIQLDLDSSVAELYTHLRNADMWLYCILLKTEQ